MTWIRAPAGMLTHSFKCAVNTKSRACRPFEVELKHQDGGISEHGVYTLNPKSVCTVFVFTDHTPSSSQIFISKVKCCQKASGINPREE